MLLINLGMMEGKENLHSIQCLSSNIFDSYNGEREYYVACNQNEYVESEGVFPKKLKQLKPILCALQEIWAGALTHYAQKSTEHSQYSCAPEYNGALTEWSRREKCHAAIQCQIRVLLTL